MTAGGDNPRGEGAPAQRGNSRCPACGRLALAQGRCNSCGHTSPAYRTTAARHGVNSPPMELTGSFGTSERSPVPYPQGDLARTAQEGRSRSVIPQPETSGHDIRVAPRRIGSKPEVSGRIIYLSSPQQEPMDFDPWRWIAIPVWGLVLLLAPVSASLFVWQVAGLLPALLVAFVSLVTLRYLFSNRLLDSWHLVSALGGRYVVEPMPVLIARLRQWDDREVQLRFKGQFSGGGLMEGDRIRAVGAWRWGVFRVREAVCERTGARITPRQPNAFRLAITGAAALLLLLLWTLLVGLPWATLQFDSLTNSLSFPTGISTI